MVDHVLVISPWAALWFYVKMTFWLYVWPMLVGFMTIFGYQMLGRISMMSTTKWPTVFAMGSVVSMVSMFGWVMMARRIGMIPFYGCGVGLASAMMSRLYAVTLPRHRWLKVPLPRFTWRGNTKEIEQLKEALRARAAAGQPGAG